MVIERGSDARDGRLRLVKLPQTLSSVPPPSRRRKLFDRILYCLAGLIVLLIVIYAYHNFGPAPPLAVSRQTTYITAPLRSDGLPDYERYARELYATGVTTENNAAVLLWQALWPGKLDPEHQKLMAAELGLPSIPSVESALQPIYSDAYREHITAWLKSANIPVDETPIEDVVGRSMNRPWQSEQFPPLADWVHANQQPLDLIVEASRRPRYYSPSPTWLDVKHDKLIDMLLAGAEGMREASRSLALRAMLHVGEDRLEAAWLDIVAIHRIARLTAQGHSLIEQIVAIACSSIACQATAALLSSEQLPLDLASRIHTELAALQNVSQVTDALDKFERLVALDAILHMRLYGADALSKESGSNVGRSIPITPGAVDWNVTLKHVNGWYDQLIVAATLPERSARERAFVKWEADLMADGTRVSNPRNLIAALLIRSARSETIGVIVANLMLPAMPAASAAEERSNTILNLTRIAAALTVYRAERGEYPKTLDALSNARDGRPVDSYHAKPFVYQRQDEGYLLYSLGANGVDDSGSNQTLETYQGISLDSVHDEKARQLREQILNEADDISIRMPIEPFSIPQPSD